MMLEEEGAVLGGLLVGLNVIDANLCIKGEDLDSQVSARNVFILLLLFPSIVLICISYIKVGVIDFSLYLKDPASSETPKE